MENNIYKMGPILHNVELESFTEDKKQITEDKNQFTGLEFTGIMAGIYFFILIIAFVYIVRLLMLSMSYHLHYVLFL